jgi:hypothetical protein
LNELWMCAIPDPTFLNSRFLRVLVCFLAAKRKLRYLSCPGKTSGVSSPQPAGFADGEAPELVPNRAAKAAGARMRVSGSAEDNALYYR